MQPKSKVVYQEGSKLYNVANSNLCSEPWWGNAGNHSLSPTMMRENASDSSSQEKSLDVESKSDGGMNEEDDDAVKHPQSTMPLQTDKTYSYDDSNLHQVAPHLNQKNDGSLPPQPQLFEVVGHSIACASNPYDPYHGGMMAAYGQPLVPHLYDIHSMRMPLPLEMTEEPVYVNAKQYNGIMRRRQSRAKAELEKKLIKDRKPYLHESRHQHALRRERGTGGRFAKKSNAGPSNGTSSGSTTASQSILSSYSDPSLPKSGGAQKPGAQQSYNNNNTGNFRMQTNSQEPTYKARSAEKREGLGLHFKAALGKYPI